MLRNGRRYKARFVNGAASDIPVSSRELQLQDLSAHFGALITQERAQVRVEHP